MYDRRPSHQNVIQTFRACADMLLSIRSAIAVSMEYPTPRKDSIIDDAGGAAISKLDLDASDIASSPAVTLTRLSGPLRHAKACRNITALD